MRKVRPDYDLLDVQIAKTQFTTPENAYIESFSSFIALIEMT